MERQSVLIRNIIFIFSLLLLSGCGLGTDAQVIRVAEQGVRDGLMYNSEEAKFSSREETELFFYGDNDEYCEVTGWVIASNQYGATTKVEYEAEVERNSGK